MKLLITFLNQVFFLFILDVTQYLPEVKLDLSLTLDDSSPSEDIKKTTETFEVLQSVAKIQEPKPAETKQPAAVLPMSITVDVKPEDKPKKESSCCGF